MEKEAKPGRVLAYQSIGFLALIGISWFDELVGLRSLVLGNHPYISDFKESTFEMLMILGVWFVVAGSTRRMLAKVKHLEGFMKVCAWCRRIEHKGIWMPLEKFFEQGFDTPTSHGICADCAEKTKRSIARDRQAGNITLKPGTCPTCPEH